MLVEGRQVGVAVPFVEVELDPSPGPGGPVENPPLRLYDTAGPGGPPEEGLPWLRAAWVEQRGDTEVYEGRPYDPRDDGRSAAARAGSVPR